VRRCGSRRSGRGRRWGRGMLPLSRGRCRRRRGSMRRGRGRRRRSRRSWPWRRRGRSLRRRWGRGRSGMRRWRWRWWRRWARRRCRSRWRWWRRSGMGRCGPRRWRRVRRGGPRRCALWRFFRPRFAVRADFFLGRGRLRHDQRRALRVGDRACNGQRRNGGGGKQHETKVDHHEYGSRIVRMRTKNKQALGRIVAAFKCRFGFISRDIVPGSAIIHDAFRLPRNRNAAA
jgi:hypothetical protein